MKNIYAFFIFILLSLFLVACTSDRYNDDGIIFTDDTPFEIALNEPNLKILQLTDLHLIYGNDNHDRKTYSLMEKLILSDHYDFIVLTGDQTMSPKAPRLYKTLISFMESFEIPWTFMFGNHDTDYHTYQDILKVIEDTTYLYFKTGPRFEMVSVGNFKITFTYEDEAFYHLYVMDSKSYQLVDGKKDYGWIDEEQFAWYKQQITLDSKPHSLFMHIPIETFELYDSYAYEGVFREKKVYKQGMNIFNIDEITPLSKLQGLFVGHDHLNDISFNYNGVILAYGRSTGYNGYGDLEKGGRHIEISNNHVLTTYVKTHTEVIS